MASPFEHPESPTPSAALTVLGRAVMIGGGVGVASGGVVGTVIAPVIGTFFGAVVGVVVGGFVGLINGFVLVGVLRLTTSNWAAAAACAVTTYACVAEFVWRNVVPQGSVPGPVGWLIVVTAAAVAAAVGPVAARGAQPVDLGFAYGPRPVSTIAGTALAIGAGSGLAIGAVIGLAIGMVTYLPTAPAALVEGGLFGAASGLVLAMLIAALVITPCLRVRR
jgi:hypothetical protein